MGFLKEILQSLSEPAYKSPNEKDFCNRWMQGHAYDLVATGYYVALPMNIVALCLFPFFIEHTMHTFFLGVHSVYFSLLLCARFFKDNQKLYVNYLTFVTVLFVLSYYHGMHLVWSLNQPERYLRVSLGVAALGMFSLQLLPLNRNSGLFCTIAYSIACIWALWAFGRDGRVVAGIMTFLFGFSFVMQHRSRCTAIREAQGEFQTRSKIAPAHILRKAMEHEKEIDQIFAPKKEMCACISSDWRSYQQLSSSLATNQLVEGLSNYYNHCEKLLEQVFPEGNYFSDWIADELFVVAYTSNAMSEAELADAALLFGEKLIIFKQQFFSEYQFPAAIDVGISFGKALLGMMGPESYRKATALGRVPGEARRLQAVGKQLREKLPPIDRVIFNKAVFTALKQGHSNIMSIQSAEVTNVRDLDDNVFYFVEPTNKHSQWGPVKGAFVEDEEAA